MAALRSRPLLLPLISLLAGIAAAGSFGICLPQFCLPLFILLAAVAILLPPRSIFLVALQLLIFACGNLVMAQMMQPDPVATKLLAEHGREQLLLEGVVRKRPEATEGGCKLLVSLNHVYAGREELPLRGLILLRVGTGKVRFASNDRLRFNAVLRQPRNFGIPGEFDSERYYALQGVVATAFVQQEGSLVMMQSGSPWSWQRYFDQQARRIGTFIMACVPPVEGAILQALLVGASGDIPQELKDAYSRTGVNHILSISGFHVGIIALALFQLWFVLCRLFPPLLLYLNLRRVAYVASLPLILYYLFLSGAAPATARSVLMLCFLMFCLLLEREFDGLNALILAALALLLLNPANLYDVSFQLSFIALWGILILTPLFMSIIPLHADSRWYKLLQFMAVSLAAITATMLPVAFYFHQAGLTGLLSNLLVVPLLGYGAVIAGFMALPLMSLLPQAAGFLFNVAGFLTALANAAITQLDRLPLLPAIVPTAADLLLALAGLLVITLATKNRLKWGVLAGVPLLLVVSHHLPVRGAEPALRIDFLSVGQGDATLITLPDRKHLLLDGGGALHENGMDVGRRLLLPALARLGVGRIDYLVLSHPHPDHLGGVAAVAAAMPVGEFWESGAVGGADYLRLKRILAERQVPVKRVNAATLPFELAGVRCIFLHPLPGVETRADRYNLNDDSLVLRLESGTFSALFTGDIGYSQELRLLREPGLLKCTLLKVPHHGSRYSLLPEFYQAVAPRIALVGAGYQNSFGLPSGELLHQLAMLNCKTYRTDLDGTITISIYPAAKRPVISTLKRHFN